MVIVIVDSFVKGFDCFVQNLCLIIVTLAKAKAEAMTLNPSQVSILNLLRLLVLISNLIIFYSTLILFAMTKISSQCEVSGIAS